MLQSLRALAPLYSADAASSYLYPLPLPEVAISSSSLAAASGSVSAAGHSVLLASATPHRSGSGRFSIGDVGLVTAPVGLELSGRHHAGIYLFLQLGALIQGLVT